MEEVELKILKEIHKIYQLARVGASSDKIASNLGMTNDDVCDFLDVLEDQGYVKVSRYIGGAYGAFLTHTGRLLLTHPEYMFNKGYVDASDVLKVLEKAVNDSENIPLREKPSLIGKLTDLSHDPYIQSISSGLVIEAVKNTLVFNIGHIVGVMTA